jgi:hypothetical protein
MGWTSPTGRPSTYASFAAAAEVAWASDTLAGLGDTGTRLANGTELFVCHIAFAADGPAFSLPPDAGDPPDFAELVAGYADVLGGPPPGLTPRHWSGVRAAHRHQFPPYAAIAPDEALVAGRAR